MGDRNGKGRGGYVLLDQQLKVGPSGGCWVEDKGALAAGWEHAGQNACLAVSLKSGSGKFGKRRAHRTRCVCWCVYC
jgi:hypothetical protein